MLTHSQRSQHCGPHTHVVVLRHRWLRMPQLISDHPCRQASLIKDRCGRLAEHVRGHPGEAFGTPCLS
jgi:hypothetical protein